MATPKDAPYKVAQRAAELAYRFRGAFTDAVHARSKPKRGPKSFHATKASWKRDRKRRSDEARERAALVPSPAREKARPR